MKSKVLIIAPHLSTGGLPQYLLWQIQTTISDVDLYLVEYRCLSSDYTVQRNKILSLLSSDHFFSLKNSGELITVVESISPDVVHWAEIPEKFCDEEIAKKIYSGDRKYKLVETTHTSTFSISHKKFLPDKFLFVSQYSKHQYESLGIPIEIVEYPVICKDRISPVNRRPQILNVGLFTPGKNQSEAFEIARRMPEADFHFLGNQADNFRSYWEPLMRSKPSNCYIHGEIENVDEWYAKSDLFLFTSRLELNPICIKEAIGWGLPIVMRDLPSYCGKYKGPFLTENIDANVLLVKNKLKEIPTDTTFRDFYSKTQRLKETVVVDVNFVNGAYVGVKSNILDRPYIARFYCNNNLLYEGRITPNNWAKTTITYCLPYTIELVDTTSNDIVWTHRFNCEGKRVFIPFDTKALGDTLCWLPYVEEFQKVNKCHVICSTFLNDLVRNTYPNIEFVEPGTVVENIYAQFGLGIYFGDIANRHKNDPRTIPMAQVASDILGLPYREISPKLTKDKHNRPISNKYVCIGTESTAQAKHWNNPTGWQEVVDYLTDKGISVISIRQSGDCGLRNVQKITGKTFQDLLPILEHCEAFIGLGSGLSWLAHALGKPVVLISGFSKPWCEFSTPYRVINEQVCHGCFNDVNEQFDRANWTWCPRKNDFECTKMISSKMVITQLDRIL